MPKGHRLRWRGDDPADAASDGVVFPLVALTLDVILLAVVFTAGAIGRLVFGRPWRIEARTIGVPHRTREAYAKGLRGSREAIDELAAAIAASP
jgi:hypothetical protein